MYKSHFVPPFALRPSRCSSVNIEAKLWTSQPGFSSRQGQLWDFISSPPRPGRLSGPPSLLHNGYRGLLRRDYSDRNVKLTTHLHLVPRLKMRGDIPPLPHTSSCRGVQLNTETSSPLHKSRIIRLIYYLFLAS